MRKIPSTLPPHPRQQVLDRIDLFQRTIEAKLDDLSSAGTRPAAINSRPCLRSKAPGVVIVMAASGAVSLLAFAAVQLLRQH